MKLVPGHHFPVSTAAFACCRSQLLCPAAWIPLEKEKSQWVAAGTLGGMGFI